MDYKKAGVDIEAGYKSVELMKKHVKETMRPEVLGGLGGFAAAFDLSAIKNMDDAVNAINSGVTDKYKLLVVVESIKDAERLCKECNINKLNLGGTKATAETRNISKAMNITPVEETIIKGLCETGVDVTIQMVPEDNPVNVEKVL